MGLLLLASRRTFARRHERGSPLSAGRISSAPPQAAKAVFPTQQGLSDTARPDAEQVGDRAAVLPMTERQLECRAFSRRQAKQQGPHLVLKIAVAVHRRVVRDRVGISIGSLRASTPPVLVGTDVPADPPQVWQ